MRHIRGITGEPLLSGIPFTCFGGLTLTKPDGGFIMKVKRI